MRYCSSIVLALWMTCTSSSASRDERSLIITAECYKNPSCIISGRRLPITLTVTNQSRENLFITIDYMRATGPYTTITDNDTGEVHYGHTSLGIDQLLAEYTMLSPGSSTKINYIIYDHEITEDPVKRQCASVTAEFDFYARWGTEEKKGLAFDNKASLVIRGARREGFERDAKVAEIGPAGAFRISRCEASNK